jgi:RNA polymerase sigma-B factor
VAQEHDEEAQRQRRLRRERVRELFERLRATQDISCRDELIAMHIGLVEYLARRFSNRGEPYEDLLQVGFVGLIKAIDRYDLERGVEFTTYATPTIIGEIKRYFRDRSWTIRVPRRLQTRDAQLSQAVELLAQQLKRTPTIQEIADYMGISEEETVEVLESSHTANYISLDGANSDDADKGFSLLEQLGEEDREFFLSEHRAAISQMVGCLDPREQRILFMRFFQGMTQMEIARELGISQMHVSRLLTRILLKMREALGE